MWAQFLNKDYANDNFVVQFGFSPDKLTYSSSGIKNVYTVENPAYTSPFIFKAAITGLVSGNKVYYYRVGTMLHK